MADTATDQQPPEESNEQQVQDQSSALTDTQTVQTEPTPDAGLTNAERDDKARGMIAQGRADDEAANKPQDGAETAPDNGPGISEAEARKQAQDKLAEQEAEKAETEKEEPLGEHGEHVWYTPGNDQQYPAIVTHVDEKTGRVSLAVFYKSHLDFVSDVSSKQQEEEMKASDERKRADAEQRDAEKA